MDHPHPRMSHDGLCSDVVKEASPEFVWPDHVHEYQSDSTTRQNIRHDGEDGFNFGSVAKSSSLTGHAAFSEFDINHVDPYGNLGTSQFDEAFGNSAMHGADMSGDGLDFSSRKLWYPNPSTQAQNSSGAHVFPPSVPFVPAGSIKEMGSDEMVSKTQQKATAADSSSSEDSFDDKVYNNVARIGIVLANAKYKCNLPRCNHKTFSRPAELRRHYTTTHAKRKPEFWCIVPFCERSAAVGGRPFHRKYRERDHMRKVHNGGVSDGGDGDTQDPVGVVSDTVAF